MVDVDRLFLTGTGMDPVSIIGEAPIARLALGAEIAVIAGQADRKIAGIGDWLCQRVDDFDQKRKVSPEASCEERRWRRAREKVPAAFQEFRRALAEMVAAAAKLDPDVEFDPVVRAIFGEPPQFTDPEVAAEMSTVPRLAERGQPCPEIRKAVSRIGRLVGMGAPLTGVREFCHAEQDRYDAEQDRREAEWNAQRGKTVPSEVVPSRGPGPPRDKRDRVTGKLEREYDGDLSRLESLFAEPKRTQAKRLGLENDVRTLERSREELAARVALGL
jgi:hypothetical protein